MKNFVFRHYSPFLFFAGLVVIGRIVSLFIDEGTIFMSGEYVYSLDYSYHWQNISDRIQWWDPNFVLKCTDCGLFYHYSWWYSYVLFSIMSLGELLGYNAFVFYLVVNLSTQYFGIYALKRVFFDRLGFVPTFLTFLVFSLSVYKISLIASGSWYGFNHGLLTLLFISLIWVLKNLKTFKGYSLMLWGVFVGFLSGFLSHITINFLPIALYSFLILGAYYFRNIKDNVRSGCTFILAVGVSSALASAPLVLALFAGGLSRTGPTYASPVNNEFFIDALSGRISLLIHDNLYIFLWSLFAFFSIFFFIKSERSRMFKLILSLLYLFVVALLMGNKLPVFNLYGWIFHHLPLMESIRSSHRFYYFILLFQAMLVFVSWEYLTSLRYRWRIVSKTFYLVVIVCFTAFNILFAKWSLDFSSIPDDYKFTAEYFKKRTSTQVLYYPFQLPRHQSMAENYLWLGKGKTGLIYTNPFDSIYFIQNMLPSFLGNSSISTYHVSSIKNASAMDFRFRSSGEVLAGIESSGAEYVVVDGNYLWKKYDFPIESLLSLLEQSDSFKLEQHYGNIYIFSISAEKRKHCDSYYGNVSFVRGNCFSRSSPSMLRGKTVAEYIYENIDQFDIGKAVMQVEPTKNENFTIGSITHMPVYDDMMKYGIIFPENIIETRLQKKNTIVFEYSVRERDEKIAVPMLLLSDEDIPLGEVTISIGNTVVEVIPTNLSPNGFRWFTYDVREMAGSVFRVTVAPDAYYLLGFPLVIVDSKAIQQLEKRTEDALMR